MGEEEDEVEGTLSPSILIHGTERDLRSQPSNAQGFQACVAKENTASDMDTSCGSREAAKQTTSVLLTTQHRTENGPSIQKHLGGPASNSSVDELHKRQSVLLKELQDRVAGLSRLSGYPCLHTRFVSLVG